MSASLSAAHLIVRGRAWSGPLEPEVLLEAGILGDPSDPNDATKRARALVARGRYMEARALLYPHASRAPDRLKAVISEQLALCSMYGGGGDWEQLLEAALAGYQRHRHTKGVARVHRHFGEMFLMRGSFGAADLHLRDAASGFQRTGELARAAMVDRLRARVRMHAGYITHALKRVDRALQVLTTLRHPRAEGLTRLDRAKILAHDLDARGAARELITAERLLAASGVPSDHLKARLMRAETLLLLGDNERAAAGLTRLRPDVVRLEELFTQGQLMYHLGLALGEAEPATARRHLMRAHHLYDKLGTGFHMAWCDLQLAKVERRIGLDPTARMKSLATLMRSEWPKLAHEFNALRAEDHAGEKPEQARAALLEARAFATDTGNRAMAKRLDDVLRRCRLVAQNEIEELTPVDTVSDRPMVQVGSVSVQRMRGTRRGPRPVRLSEDGENGAKVAVRPGLPAEAALIDPQVRTSPSVALAAPKAGGVKS